MGDEVKAEAPEEAGEREGLAAELDRLADCEGGMRGGSERAAETMRQAAKHLRAQPQAREEEGGTLDPAFVAWLKERDCLPNDDDGTIEWADIVCALNDWEADLTPAREDAQPVAWVPVHPRNGPIWPECGPDARSKDNLKSYPFMAVYTHPAPDALREHERLFKALRDESWDLRCFNIPTGGDDFDIGWRVIGHWQVEPHERTIAEVFSDDSAEAVRQALAALQAEQKGGAA